MIPSTMDVAGNVIGQVLDGRYRVVKKIGEGGMGSVYEAVHTSIGSRSAVKLLHQEFSRDPDVLRRFHREAHAAAAIGHEAIIEIQDVGMTPDGSHFIVMEYLHGESLRGRLEACMQIDVPSTAYVACQVLSGLAAAHGVGIVHRDLKPENVFLVEQGSALPGVKLLDFGISRVSAPVAADGEPTNITATGIIMGTPEYMSPEQAMAAKDLDARTDIYAVGVLLYECLTGQCPFSIHNAALLLALIQGEEPESPRTLEPTIPVELEAIVLRALKKDRGARFQNATEMFEALLPFVQERAMGRLVMPARQTISELAQTLPSGTPAYVDDGETSGTQNLGSAGWGGGAAVGPVGPLVGAPSGEDATMQGPGLIGVDPTVEGPGLYGGGDATVADPTPTTGHGGTFQGHPAGLGPSVDSDLGEIPQTVAQSPTQHTTAKTRGRKPVSGMWIGVLIGIGVSSVAVAGVITALFVLRPPPHPRAPMTHSVVGASIEPTPGGATGDAGPTKGGPVVVPMESSTVEVAIEGLPEGARVLLNGEESPALPLVVARGTVEVEVRIEAEGYEPFVTTLQPNRDHTVTPELIRRRRGGSGRRPRPEGGPTKEGGEGGDTKRPDDYRPTRFDLSG